MAVAPERTRLTWDYSPAPESADHVRLRDAYGVFVDGEFSDPRSGKSAPTVNPATEQKIASIAVAGDGDLRQRVLGGRVDGRRGLAAARIGELAVDEQAVGVAQADVVGRLGGRRVVPGQAGAFGGGGHPYSLEKSSARP